MWGKILVIVLAVLLLLSVGALYLLDERVSAADEDTISLPVVMYHHISRDPAKWGPYVVSESEFEADLKWLRSHGYETVSVQNLLDWEAGAFTMPEKPCMITLDDGARSTMAYAEPLLARYGFCAVSAVIGSVCQKFSENGETDDELSSLSWEAARDMAERGTVEIICHTWNMHSLGQRRGCARMQGESETAYRYALSRDLSRFLTACEAAGLRLTPAIAYPYGAYSRATTEAVADFGFLAAFTCDEKVNRLTGAEEELLHLGRFNRPHGASGEKIFEKWEENS